MKESKAKAMIEGTLKLAGLSDVFVLGLFGGRGCRTVFASAHADPKTSSENAALPHGSGTDRELGKHDFALFDVGGSLHGYQSDITRVSIAFI